MTLMFGNLTLAFVRFGTAVQSLFAPGAGPAAMQEFNDAADEFKRSAASDALYLVCIGMFPLLSLPLEGPPPGLCHRGDLDFLSSYTFPEPLLPMPHPFSPFYLCPFPSGVSARTWLPGGRLLTLHFRSCFDCDHVYIHVDMDIHGRNQCEAHP